MDNAAHQDVVRDHYNQHSNRHATREQALRARAQGAAKPLKDFHNRIKGELISRFTPKNGTLIDFCCGRGGDINKWMKAGVGECLEIAFVHGVDISPGEVAEAQRRFQDIILQKRQNSHKFKGRSFEDVDYQFHVSDNLGEKEYVADDGPFDLATCMFAMHYFFQDERKLRMFIRNVSKALKPGGFFIGTVPDGKRIIWHLKGKKQFRSSMLHLERRWNSIDEVKQQPFGHKYLWALSDTVTEGVGKSRGSVEFLTYATPILRICAHYGLVPVFDYGNRELNKLFEKEDRDMPFKHFQPYFPANPDLEIPSSIFMAFVFRKLNDGEVPMEIIPPLPKEIAAMENGQQGHPGGNATSYPEDGMAAAALGHLGKPAIDYGTDEDDDGHNNNDDDHTTKQVQHVSAGGGGGGGHQHTFGGGRKRKAVHDGDDGGQPPQQQQGREKVPRSEQQLDYGDDDDDGDGDGDDDGEGVHEQHTNGHHHEEAHAHQHEHPQPGHDNHEQDEHEMEEEADDDDYDPSPGAEDEDGAYDEAGVQHDEQQDVPAVDEEEEI